MNKIEKFINRLRDSHVDIEYLYMEGQCYNFSLILRELWPQSIIYYSQMEGHVYTKIDDHFYDIRGKHLVVPDDLEILDHKNGHKPYRWTNSDYRRLS